MERLLAGSSIPLFSNVCAADDRRRVVHIGKDGEFRPGDITAQIASCWCLSVFTMLFFISVVMAAGACFKRVRGERENRADRGDSSSIDSDDLMMGKLIGLGGAGLLQIAMDGLVTIVQVGAGIALAARAPGGSAPNAASIAWSLVSICLDTCCRGPADRNWLSRAEPQGEPAIRNDVVMGSVVPWHRWSCS